MTEFRHVSQEIFSRHVSNTYKIFLLSIKKLHKYHMAIWAACEIFVITYVSLRHLPRFGYDLILKFDILKLQHRTRSRAHSVLMRQYLC